MIPNDIFSYMEKVVSKTKAAEIDKIVSHMNMTQEQLLELDYIFIPHFSVDKTHYVLAGITPKQKFVFTLDGCLRNYKDAILPYEALRAFALCVLPAVYWPLYTQFAWKPSVLRRPKTSDGSLPIAVRQIDLYNCGIFMSTNAFCWVMGYDLNCYSQDKLDEGKRD